MKGKKFYIILIGLVIIGLTSIFFYQRQQEARFSEFKGYEISEIEARVAALYNEDETDIVKDISENELEELTAVFEDLEEDNFERRNERRLKDAQLDFLMAKEMHNLQQEVQKLFVEEEVVDCTVSIETVNNLQKEVEVYEIKPVYFERNMEFLEDAKSQLTTIETAKKFIDQLFEEDGETVHADVTREDEEEAQELIQPIRNEEVKEELTERIEVVDLVLTEREEALALEEALEALEEEEESEEELIEEEPESEEDTEYTLPRNNWGAGTTEEITPPSNGRESERGMNGFEGSNNTGNAGQEDNSEEASEGTEAATSSGDREEGENGSEDTGGSNEIENTSTPSEPETPEDEDGEEGNGVPDTPTEPEDSSTPTEPNESENTEDDSGAE